MDLSKVTAYKVIKEKKLTDIRSTGYLLRHIKTGARVMLIENDDENKVFKEPLTSSTNGSLSGNSLDPQSTLCSRICATPVLFFGGVRKAILNTLFSSSFSMSITLAPVLICRSR